jgi:hypothetical protein
MRITERRTKIDFAHCMRYIVQSYPDDEVIRVVLDEVRAIANKLEFHYTPKHGNWLYIAEIELGKH